MVHFALASVPVGSRRVNYGIIYRPLELATLLYKLHCSSSNSRPVLG